MRSPSDSTHRQSLVGLVALLVVAATLPAAAAGAVAGTPATADGPAATATAAVDDGPTTVSITELQSNTTSGGASAYAGANVTVSGTVTATASDGFYVQERGVADPAHSGVFVYTGDVPDVAAGEVADVTGLAKEYYDLTEVDVTVPQASVTTTGTADVPDPVGLSTANVSREAYEGVLVRVTGVRATSTPDGNGEWDVTDGSGPVAVDDVSTGDSTTPAERDTLYQSVEGPVHYSFGAFKIRPSAVVEEPTTPITELQSNTTGGGSSAYAGTNVTTFGTVTATASDGFYLQETGVESAAYSGVFVYTDGTPAVSTGDAATVAGPLTEFHNLTEVDATAAHATVETLGTKTPPAPASLSTANASSEAYESVLVRVTDVNVTETPGEFGEWAVSDGSGPVAVDDVGAGDPTTPADANTSYATLEGPVHYSFGAFKIRPSLVEAAGPADGTEVTLIGYNDVGKAAAGSGSDPLGRMITLINERRARATGPVFVAGGGDQISPHALRNYDGLDAGWEPPVRALNVIDPDADVVQNHELDYDEDRGTTGFAVFEAVANESAFPWLLANVVDTEDGSNLPGTRNYTVVERDGVRVGFFGVTDGAINAKTDGVVERNGYEVLDPTAVSRSVTDTLREEENVDVVVALAPLGIPDSKSLARQVDGIDALVSGDDQRRYPPRETDGTLVAETTGSANAVVEMSLVVEDGTVTEASGRLINVTDSVDRNESWKAYINPLRQAYLNENLTTAVMPADPGGSSYTDDTATGNLITQGIRAYTGADAALTNAGGIRDTLYPDEHAPGETVTITRGMVTSTLSFGNQIVVVNVTGAELKAVARSQINVLEGDFEYGVQTQQQVGGLTFEWVPHTDVANPGDEGFGTIQDVSVGGEPLNESATYRLAVNSYIADGGSGFPLGDKEIVRYYNETTMADGLIAYLEGRERVEAAEVDATLDDRMRRVDTTLGPANVSVARSGSDTVLTVDAPDRVTGVEGTATLSDRQGTHVEADSVTYDATNGTVAVTVATSELAAFPGPLTAPYGDIDVYVPYNDTAYDGEYENFAWSVLNVDLASGGQTPAGVSPPVFEAVAGGDGELSRSEVLTMVQRYAGPGTVDGTPLTRADVLALVRHYVSS